MTLSKLPKRILQVCLTAGLLAGVWFVAANVFVYNVGGGNNGVGGSMEPTIPVEAYVCGVQTTGPFKPGDVITFHEGGHIVTHTFIGYNEDGTLKTKGDANEEPDRFSLHEEDVIGKVVFHTQVGGVLAILVCVIVVMLAMGLIVWILRQIWRSPPGSKNNNLS